MTVFLSYGDRSFDAVISEGVINLAPDKEALFRELYRVLRPDGRLLFADAAWLGMTGFRTSEYTGGAMFRASKN